MKLNHQKSNHLNLDRINPDIRYLKEMKSVIYDKQWLKGAPNNLKLYYMYRGIKKRNGLRYDITIIPPQMLGEEFVKTKGHFHSDAYQELYVVLEGEAIFLLQKNKEEEIVSDVYAIKAKKDDIIIVPPKYGHITINPSNYELKIGNWVSENCQNKYDLFEKMNGACFFYTKNGWIKNKNYKQVPNLRFEKPLNETPKSLDFLK